LEVPGRLLTLKGNFKFKLKILILALTGFNGSGRGKLTSKGKKGDLTGRNEGTTLTREGKNF